MANIIFSYGSNSIAQLRARVENPALEAYPAQAVDWQRIFCVRTATWGGAAASIIPFKGSIVYGAVVFLEDVELERLDRFEGGYHRNDVEVLVWNGTSWQTQSAIAYIANSLFWTVPPSEAYLTAIHINLREQFSTLQPDCVEHIHIHGVICTDKNTAMLHDELNKEISHDNGHSDMSSANLDKVSVTSIKDFRQTDCHIERISKWAHPGAPSLSLPALCVEVNAARTVKWVMPRAVVGVVEELKRFGIHCSAHLAAKLALGWTLDVLDSEKRSSLEYLDNEAVRLFADLLQINMVVSDVMGATFADSSTKECI